MENLEILQEKTKRKWENHFPHFMAFTLLSINHHFNSTIMAVCAGILRAARSSTGFPEITS
jgi:hypothetical protein